MYSRLAGVEALNLAKWPIGGGQEQAIMASLGHHMWRLTQLDLADTLVCPAPLMTMQDGLLTAWFALALSCLRGSCLGCSWGCGLQ